MADTCICCGAVIPEGRQTCPACSRAAYDPAEFFSAERVVTNEDCVRNMSTDDLVDLLIGDGEGCCPPEDYQRRKAMCKRFVGRSCRDCWMDWLKSPAEVRYGK